MVQQWFWHTPALRPTSCHWAVFRAVGVTELILKASLYVAQNKMHINDWSAIQTLFDKLNKQLEKSMKVHA